MLLSKALQEKLLDVRLRDKLLVEEKVSKKQIEEYLTNLPDDANTCTYTEMNEGENQRQ